MKIIIIDDSRTILAILTGLLEFEGYKVEGFMLPEEGLDYLLNNDDYDLIVCDIDMPVLNGLELFKKFRQQKPSKIPFIFNTGHAQYVDDATELMKRYPPTRFVNKESNDLSVVIKDMLHNV